RPPAMPRAMFFSVELVVVPGRRLWHGQCFSLWSWLLYQAVGCGTGNVFLCGVGCCTRPSVVARVMVFSVELVVVPGCRRQVTGIERFRCNYWCGFDFAQARLLYNGSTPADVCYYGSSNFGLENIKNDR
ncbi:MAG: hypothetical protein VYA08_11250, partial [Pseudomonadota bacterium]|nr:hypothetical protein [Pseudomonadota bacterium]